MTGRACQGEEGCRPKVLRTAGGRAGEGAWARAGQRRCRGEGRAGLCRQRGGREGILSQRASGISERGAPESQLGSRPRPGHRGLGREVTAFRRPQEPPMWSEPSARWRLAAHSLLH